MLNPREWTEEYVRSLPIGEFDWLEVKGRRGLDLTLPQVNEGAVREILAKAVSAFANSGGGVLVYGMANPQEGWLVDDGGVDLRIKGAGTREWLEDVIPTLVEFPLSVFNVYVIQREREDSQIGVGRGMFLIEIGDSEAAPHQSTIDQRYYARVAGKSRPLPHRLVVDIFNRRRHPQFEIEFWVQRIERRSSFPTFPMQKQEPIIDKYIHFQVTNVGRVLANYVNVIVRLPTSLVHSEWVERGEIETRDGKEYLVVTKRNSRRDLVGHDGLSPRYGPSWFDPILPGRSQSWDSLLRDVLWPQDVAGEGILWEIYADNSPVTRGKVAVRDIPLREIEQPFLP